MKNAENFDDIIFENRNKEYGAYFLRKNYNSYLTRATIIGSSCFILLFGGAFTYNKYIVKEKIHHSTDGVTIDFSPPPVEPTIDIIEVTPPPPKQNIIPPATITYLPPKIVADDIPIIETPPPTQEEMEGKHISNKTTQGTESNELISVPLVPETVKLTRVEEPEETKIFIAVEQKPQYPNGDNELYKFLAKNIHYPEAAVRANVSGKVFVKFVVEKDGSIGDIEVTKGIGFGCDEEAERVIKLMPKWLPGKQNGKAVRVYFNMPVVYKLE